MNTSAKVRGKTAHCFGKCKTNQNHPQRQRPSPIALQGLVRLLDSATRLNEIVEGVRNERWEANGQRLKATPEWCDFYCKLKVAAQQPNDQAES